MLDQYVLKDQMMSRSLRVHLLPAHFEPEVLAGGVAIVVDILRATTTLAVAFQNGVRQVFPCESVEQAQAMRTERGSELLLGGERHAQLIPGFDLDNSPSRWNADTVRDREVAFTTTNGTRALLRSSRADRILTGAFVNLSAVERVVSDDARPVHIVCAGTDGKITSEDCLFAGALAERLLDDDFDLEPDDVTTLAVDHWTRHSQSREALITAMLSGHGGRNLRRIGMESDVAVAAEIDAVDAVPEYLPESAALRPVAR